MAKLTSADTGDGVNLALPELGRGRLILIFQKTHQEAKSLLFPKCVHTEGL